MSAVDPVRRMIAATAAGDHEAALACMSEDIVFDLSSADMAVVRGRAELARFFRTWWGAWRQYEFDQRELVELGDGRVVSVFVERGVGRGSGVVVEEEHAGIWTVRGGKIVAWKRYDSREAALAAAGPPA